MGIKVYGTELCPQCQGAKQYLKQKGIDKKAEADTNREVLAWMPLPEIYEEEIRSYDGM